MDKNIISQKILDEIEDINQAIFPVYKPLGWTSFDLVRFIKGKYKIKKIGHGGTLDPLATGIVLIFTGKNTKLISQYQKKSKTYIAKIVFGATTKSLDGEFFPERFIDSSQLNIEEIIEIINQKFVGNITQIPPIFSALKYKGKPLYHIARNDKNLSEDEINQLMIKKKRDVEINSFNILNSRLIAIDQLPLNSHLLLKDGKQLEIQNSNLVQELYQENKEVRLLEIECEIVCQSGTYIRSIARDLSLEMGFDGYLTSLNRVDEYGFSQTNIN